MDFLQGNLQKQHFVAVRFIAPNMFDSQVFKADFMSEWLLRLT